jgi:hypothetical protein
MSVDQLFYIITNLLKVRSAARTWERMANVHDNTVYLPISMAPR